MEGINKKLNDILLKIKCFEDNIKTIIENKLETLLKDKVKKPKTKTKNGTKVKKPKNYPKLEATNGYMHYIKAIDDKSKIYYREIAKKQLVKDYPDKAKWDEKNNKYVIPNKIFTGKKDKKGEDDYDSVARRLGKMWKSLSETETEKWNKIGADSRANNKTKIDEYIKKFPDEYKEYIDSKTKKDETKKKSKKDEEVIEEVIDEQPAEDLSQEDVMARINSLID